jgi:hypothetical protein
MNEFNGKYSDNGIRVDDRGRAGRVNFLNKRIITNIFLRYKTIYTVVTLSFNPNP